MPTPPAHHPQHPFNRSEILHIKDSVIGYLRASRRWDDGALFHRF